MLKIKRAYEPSSPKDGKRILIDRLWPRGLKKEEAQVDEWLKDLAPSTELRKWFGHDPARWNEFRRRYFIELQAHPQAWQPLLRAAAQGHITLVYSAHDTEHNAAVALREFLGHKLGGRRSA